MKKLSITVYGKWLSLPGKPLVNLNHLSTLEPYIDVKRLHFQIYFTLGATTVSWGFENVDQVNIVYEQIETYLKKKGMDSV